MRILVFTHGTTTMHSSAVGQTRGEIIQQVKNNDPSVLDFDSYVPIGRAVKKLKSWSAQGAELIYMCSHTEPGDVETEKGVLKRHGFPPGPLFFRRGNETHGDAIARIEPLPDIIIEDDCESIGGEKETCYYSLKPELKEKIKSIIVKEFGGIDHLPDDINAL